MAVGRKPLPSNIHHLNGNPGKRKHNLDHARVEIETPPCPQWLPKGAKTEWRYIVKELKRFGIITRLDKSMLAAHCSAVNLLKLSELKLQSMENEAAYLQSTPNGMQVQSAWFQIRNKAIDQIKSTAPEFGLTPSARTRVKVNNTEQGDMFDDF